MILKVSNTNDYKSATTGTVDELIAHFKAKTVKGEIVVVLGGKDE